MSKRVLVVTSDVPFVHGGHRVIADELVAALRRSGHQSELVRTPSNRFGRTLQAYLATWLTDVGLTGYGDEVDHVISLRYPAYAVRHPRHTAWVIHRMREYYDLWDHFSSHLSRRALVKEEVRRQIIHALDRYLLVENASARFCISDTVGERLDRWGDIEATTLHPPAPVRDYRTEAYEPYVFAISRLHRWKRMDLLVEAVAESASIRAVIAGDGPELENLRRLAKQLGVEERIQFVGALSEEELLDHYARAAVIYFAPVREDYGFVTIEAFMSRKPVVTCHDSGGVTELVRDDVNGGLVEPTKEAVAARLEALVDDPKKCQKLGDAAFDFATGLSWENTVKTLLGETT